MNIFEKRLAELANLDAVTPGDKITIVPHYQIITGQSTVNVINAFYKLGYEKIANPTRALIFSHSIEKSLQKEVNRFCNEYGLNLFDESPHQYFHSKNLLLSELVVAGNDKETSYFGGNGTIPIILSPAVMASCLGTGSFDLFMPETIYIELNGTFNGQLNGEILCNCFLEYFKDSLIGNAIILGGSMINHLNLNERKNLSAFFDLSGAAMGIISPAGPLGQVESVIKIKTDSILSGISK